jgi:hypothetical protein
MRWAILAALLLGVSAARAIPDGEKPVEHVKKRFAAEIKCGGPARDPNRAWCPVTKMGSQPLSLPPAPAVLLGFSMSMLDGDSVVRQMGKNGQLAVLCFRPGKVEAKLTRLEESDDTRRAQLAPVKPLVSAALADEAKTIPLPAALFGELQEICKSGPHNAEDLLVDGTLDQKLDGAPLSRVGSSYVIFTVSSSTRTQVAVVSAAPLEKK